MATKEVDRGVDAWESLANASLEGPDNSCSVALRASDSNHGGVMCDCELRGVNRTGFGALVGGFGGFRWSSGESCLLFEATLIG